jgi:pilus assembly protein CpaE
MSIITFPQVTVVGARERDVEAMLSAAGIRATSVSLADLPALAHPTSRPRPVVMVDLRDTKTLPPSVSGLRRAHPSTAVVLLVSTLDPTLLLDAVRAGVGEIVPEPLTQDALEGAVSRVWQPDTSAAKGQIIGVIGAKGGVGATTLAVSLSAVLAREAPGETLLADFHLAHGDAAMLLAAEPRFSVVDALENTQRLDEAYFRGLVVQVKKGPDLLASSDRHVVGSPAADRVRALVDFAARTYRFVVLDVPRADLTMLDGLEAAHRLVLVVNHELPAIRSATRLVDTLGQRYGKDRLVLVLNRFDKASEIAVQDIEKVVGLPVRYRIPNDYRAAVRALNQGQALAYTDGHKVGGSLKAMARELGGVVHAELDTAPSGGLLGRLALRRT